MGIYLMIGGTDVSRFITENNYSVSSEPVYDEEGSFVNILGEKVRKRTGKKVSINAVLSDVDNASAAALSAAVSAEKCTAAYSAPDEKTGEFECTGFSLSLDRVYRGEKFWTAKISLLSSFSPDDCL